MLGDCRLGNARLIGQQANRPLAVPGQTLEDQSACRVTRGPEKSSGLVIPVPVQRADHRSAAHAYLRSISSRKKPLSFSKSPAVSLISSPSLYPSTDLAGSYLIVLSAIRWPSPFMKEPHSIRT